MKKILAIDDQIDNLITIKAVIKSRIPNCEVLTALSGQDGINMAIKKQPDTILLDIIMPEMDGFKTCKKLKENELTKHIPVVMLTAIKTDSESRVKGLNMGADAFLSKPIDAVELGAQVNVMLRIKEAEDKLRGEKELLDQKVKERTKELSVSENRYHSLFDFSPVPVLIHDGEKILDVNPALMSALNIKEKDVLIGTYPFSFVHPADFKKSKERLKAMLKENTPLEPAEFRIITPHTGERIVIATPVPIILDNQQAYMINYHDITERKLAEKKIRKLSTAVEQSPSVIAITDLAGNIEYVNPKFTELTGYTSEEAIGQNPRILKSGEQPNSIYKEMWESISKGKEWHGEFHNKKKNGELFWETVSISPIIDEKGKTTNYIKVAEDITERRLAQERLKESEERFRQITLNSQEWIWEVDTKGMYTFASPIMENLLGYKAEEIIGKKYFYDFFIPEERSELKNAAFEAFKQKKPFKEFVNRNLSKDHKIVWLSTSGIPKLDDDGELIGYRGADTNITERKLAEIALAEQSQRLEHILEGTNAGTWDWQVQSGAVVLNNRWAEIMGYTLKELMPIDINTWVSNVHPDDLPNANALLDKVFSKKLDYFDVEFRQPHKNGKWIWVNARGKVIEWAKDGKPLRISGTHIDITERKRAEQIQNILYKISNAVSSTANLEQLIGFIQKELGTIIDTTNFYLALYDQQTDTLTLPFFADEHDSFKTLPAEKTITRYVVQTQKSLLANLETIHQLENSGVVGHYGADSLIWLGVPLKVEGKVIGIIALQSYTDENAYNESDLEVLEFIADQISISIHRKNTNELLEKSEERFDLAMKASKDGLYDWNLITNEVYYSERWKNILGYTDEELPNDISIWESLSHPQEKEESLLKLQNAIDKKIEHYNVEFRMKHKLDHWVNILSRAQIIFNEEGKAIRAVGTHSDLTKQKKAEQDLRTALNKAEESDRLKSAFLANMSHEIRTPMNGILGFTSLLKEPHLSGDEQQNFIKIIERSGARMLNTINDIVDISKIEAGQMKVEISEISINEQVEFLYTFFKPEAENKGIKLSFKNGLADKEDNIKTDRVKLNAILTNLVKNAIKYSHNGSIEFGYIPTDSNTKLENVDEFGKVNKYTELTFYVKDTGIGIPKNRQKAVFDRFIQADIEDKQVYEGSGLGLAISKAYIEMLGGKIWVKSIEGEGSQFYFTLPHQIKSDKNSIDEIVKSNSNLKANPKKLNILIAEDDETSVIYLKTIIKVICNEVFFAKTGLEAIEICKTRQDIDLVFMDIKMPEMDGYEATQKIREFNKDVIILAQTAYALPGDREKALEAGCNDYIAKPISKNNLLEMIGELFEK